MSEDRTEHVLDAIDHALEDWAVSEDAMRWTPEAHDGELPDWVRQPPVDHHTHVHTPLTPPPGWMYSPGRGWSQDGVNWQGGPLVPAWLAGIRIVEDEGVPPGEVALSVDSSRMGLEPGGLVARHEEIRTSAEELYRRAAEVDPWPGEYPPAPDHLHFEVVAPSFEEMQGRLLHAFGVTRREIGLDVSVTSDDRVDGGEGVGPA